MANDNKYSTEEFLFDSEEPVSTNQQPSLITPDQKTNNFTIPGATRDFSNIKFTPNFDASVLYQPTQQTVQQTQAIPETYQTKTFDRDAKLKEMYGTNASKRDIRKFNKYWNSDQRWADQDAFEAAEHQKYVDSLDQRWNAMHEQVKQKTAAFIQGVQGFEDQAPGNAIQSEQKQNTTDWNAIAASKLGKGKTTEDVKKLQQEMFDAGYDLGTSGPNGDGVDGFWGSKTQKAYDLYLKNGKKPLETEVITTETKPDNKVEENQGNWHWFKNAKKNSLGQLMWGSGWRDRYIGDNFYNYGNNRYRIVVNKDKDQSYLVDLTNGKYMQADEDIWGRIDNDAMNNRLAQGSGWMDITKESGLFQYKIGGIIKQILKNSKVYPYNLK